MKLKVNSYLERICRYTECNGYGKMLLKKCVHYKWDRGGIHSAAKWLRTDEFLAVLRHASHSVVEKKRGRE